MLYNTMSVHQILAASMFWTYLKSSVSTHTPLHDEKIYKSSSSDQTQIHNRLKSILKNIWTSNTLISISDTIFYICFIAIKVKNAEHTNIENKMRRQINLVLGPCRDE